LPAAAHKECAPEIGAIKLISDLLSICFISYSTQKSFRLLLCCAGTYDQEKKSQKQYSHKEKSADQLAAPDIK